MKTLLKWFAASLGCAVLATQALAYFEYNTPGSQSIGTVVMMFLNGSGQAIPWGNGNAPPAAVTHLAPQHSTAVETSHRFASSAATLHGLSITTGSVAGFLLVLDLAADPGNGAVSPVKCAPLAANQMTSISADPGTDWSFSNGIIAVFSTTGCFIETQSATAYFSGQ